MLFRSSVYLWFSVVVQWRAYLWIYLAWSSKGFWNMWPDILHRCRPFLSIISWNIVSAQFPLSFLSGIPIIFVIDLSFYPLSLFPFFSVCHPFFFFLSTIFILGIFFWPNFQSANSLLSVPNMQSNHESVLWILHFSYGVFHF